MSSTPTLMERVNTYADANDTDVIAYFGNIQRPLDDQLISACRNRAGRKKNVILFVTTRGGDPNAAYRMGRCLQVVYSPTLVDQTNLPVPDAVERGKFSVFVNSVCKSAGTLLALSADELIMTGNAELGPLDIQLRKPDEVGERTSGLTPIQAIQFLENQSVQLFRRYFATLRFDNDLNFSAKMSADIAANMSKGLLGPIYEQIDPLKLAEVNRSLSITSEYADRLQRNLKDESLVKLITKYPSHGFVIDREEAKTLFEVVKKADDDLFMIGELFRSLAEDFVDAERPFMIFLNDVPTPESEVQHDQ